MSKEVKKWNAIIEQYKASGLSQVKFCKEFALARHQFQYRWYLYNRAQKPSDTLVKGKGNASAISTFEPITISMPSAVKEPSYITGLVIHLPNRIRCDVTIDLSSNAVTTLLRELVSLC